MDTIATRDAQRSHDMRVHPHHMQAAWKDVVSEGDQLARDASLADKSSIVCRTGQLMLASGTGAWRVRDSMNRVARILGLTVHVDLSLLSIECTCIQGHESFSEVVSLPTTGVNTHRIWLMEDYVREVEAHGSELTVRDFHKLLDVVEHSTPDYTLWQLGAGRRQRLRGLRLPAGRRAGRDALRLRGRGPGKPCQGVHAQAPAGAVQLHRLRRGRGLRLLPAGPAGPLPP